MSTITREARDLLERHLDLGPLRGRRRGLVRCIFHGDERASLSVDLDRGLFHCFGCGMGGGLRRFSELVGERSPASAWPRRALSVYDEALRLARSHPAYRDGVRDLYAIADYVRSARRACAHDRARATRLGDVEEAWEALERCARVERLALAVEADADEVLRGGRLW